MFILTKNVFVRFCSFVFAILFCDFQKFALFGAEFQVGEMEEAGQGEALGPLAVEAQKQGKGEQAKPQVEVAEPEAEVEDGELGLGEEENPPELDVEDEEKPPDMIEAEDDAEQAPAFIVSEAGIGHARYDKYHLGVRLVDARLCSPGADIRPLNSLGLELLDTSFAERGIQKVIQTLLCHLLSSLV
jgi:hypothetical protein